MSLTDGIIGCWSPSVRGSGYLLPDLSGRGNHGTLTNMDAGTDWPGAAVRGVHGPVVDYDGANDFVNCGTNLNPALTTEMSIVIWGAFRTRNVTLSIISNIATVGNNGFALEIGRTSDKLSWLQNGATVDATSTGTISDANWHHVALTRTGSTGNWTITFGIDGVFSTHTTTANPVASSSNGTLSIGRAGSFLGSYVNAQIGEVALYRRALPQAEIRDLFRQGNGAIGRQLTGQTRRRVYGFVPAAGFKAYWARRQNQIIGGGV